MKNKLLKIAVSLIAVISLAVASATLLIGCTKNNDNSDDSSSGGDKTIVKISAETATVAEFETIKLSATVENGDETVKWSTSDSSVATVDQDGLVLGVKSGKCNIIAMSGKAMATCALTVTDSVLNGEYLAWYSDRLTLIRCHIKGTQPFCYCRRLTLIDCTMEDCDLVFEYSDVKADIRSEVLSVKNPHKGRIVADKIGEIILTDNSVYPVKAKIEERNK